MRTSTFRFACLLLALFLTGCGLASSTPKATPAITIVNARGTVVPDENWVETDSLEEAHEHVSFAMLVPGSEAPLPGLRLYSVHYLATEGSEAIVLTYQDNKDDARLLTLQQIKLAAPISIAYQQTVQTTVRGQRGYLVESTPGDLVTLIWEESSVMYSLSGPFTPEELIKVADKLATF